MYELEFSNRVPRFACLAAALAWLLPFAAGCALGTGDEEIDSSQSPLCTGVQISSDASGPVSGSVVLTARGASCAAGESPEYRFVYRRDGTTALVDIQNWSTASSVTWNTTGLPSGSYHVFVYVSPSGNLKQPSHAWATLLVGQVCSAVSLSSDLPSPQAVGAVLSLTAAATCSGGTPEYQFTARPRIGPSVMIQDWSSSATATFNTLGLAAGPYTIYASTRVSGNLAFDAQRPLAFRLGETCTAPTLTTSPASPAALGADVLLTASATCTGAAAPEFRFLYRPSATKAYSVIRDWGSAASTTWHTAGLPADNYGITLETRASDYAGPSQASHLSTFIVGPACGTVTLVGSPKSPPPLGATLTFTADATCGAGNAEYLFSARSPGSTSYEEFRSWGRGTASFPTAGLAGGEYSFKVRARALGNVAAYQAQRAVSYDLGGVCNRVLLSTSPPSPSSPGEPVTLTGTATCVNGGVPEYQFAARAVGSIDWTLLRDWGPASTVWDTSLAPWNSSGDYELRVSARGQGQLGPAESARTVPYGIRGGCVTNSMYDLLITSSFTQKFPRPPLGQVGNCDVSSGSFQRTLQAVVVGDHVEVIGEGFNGAYSIVEESARGFRAEAGSLAANALACGNFLPNADYTGIATLEFNCSTASVTFNATCISDYGANGCYPDYIETATGSGTRSLVCDAGYQVDAGHCVDIDECAAGSPCQGKEICTNTVGTFSCACDAPAKVCNGSCVSTDSDVANCGACSVACSAGQRCAAGVCEDLTCPAGFAPVNGECTDVDECAASPGPCDANANCTNQYGAFSCACKSGFIGDGKTCTDIDECLTEPCLHYLNQHDATCTNLPGSYRCSCDLPAVSCHGWDCWDLSKDSSNCGACGHVCAANQVCEAGACVTATCPGTGGPNMVALPRDNGYSYCIDTTEVTRSQYAAWLATNPSTSAQDPSVCAWNSSFVPSCSTASGYWPPGDNGNRPVVCVDWCDAAAYCSAVGKRLCGSPLGGATPPYQWNNVNSSQWYNACTSHGQYAYAYGTTYLASACNESGSGAGMSLDVGSIVTCQSPSASFAGVYDMNGNVGEWENSCSTGLCAVRGGGYTSDRIDCASQTSYIRSGTSVSVGFRCCADLL